MLCPSYENLESGNELGIINNMKIIYHSNTKRWVQIIVASFGYTFGYINVVAEMGTSYNNVKTLKFYLQTFPKSFMIPIC